MPRPYPTISGPSKDRLWDETSCKRGLPTADAELSDPAVASGTATTAHGLTGPREGECRGLVRRLRRLEVVPPARPYEAGEELFLRGEPGDGLYVLTKGIVKLHRSYSGGKEIALRLVGPWEPFGDLAPGVPLAQGAGARAFTACEAIKVPKVFVERAIRADRGVAVALLTLYGLELAYGKELVGCLLPDTTAARLGALLTLLAERFGEAGPGGGVSLPPLTHFDLAAMVATTRESVTAAMGSLRRQGVLKKEGRTITILKPEGLTDAALRRARAGDPSRPLKTGAGLRKGVGDASRASITKGGAWGSSR